MKLFALCTPSHAVLRDEWFLPTLQDDFDVRVSFVDQAGGGAYRTEDFQRALRAKVRMVVEGVQAHRGEAILISDVDVQFFGSIEPLLREALQDRDIAAQNDGPGGFCTGFFAVRCNAGTEALFVTLRHLLETEFMESEQMAFNRILRDHDVRVAFLPTAFYSPGQALRTIYETQADPCGGTGGPDAGEGAKPAPWRWAPGVPLSPPEDIVVHHATWTVGIENKKAQLAYVRELVEGRRAATP